MRRWKTEPWRFAHDTMRWPDQTGRLAPLRLENYQREFMMSRHRFRGINKSRQIGYSFIFAVESLTRAVLDPGHTSVFMSYNQADARQKIKYIHDLLDSSPAVFKIADIQARKDAVRVRRHGQKQWSEIKSLPCRAARGYTKADLYLDEIAHYQDAEAIYNGSIPASIRAVDGSGQVTLASTPNGRVGIFWECIEGPRSRPYWKQTVPWWESQYMCVDVAAAHVQAPGMDTEDRVVAFGNSKLREVFEGYALPDFQQEFEAEFIDEGMSYYPLDLLHGNVDPMHDLAYELSEVEARRKGDIYVGVDIGRFNDTTEVVLVDRYEHGEEEAESPWAYRVMMVQTFDRMDHVAQEVEFRHILDRPNLVERLWIDSTGMGTTLHDRLKADYWNQVTGVMFSARTKEHMAVLVRRVLERGLVDLPDPESRDAKAARRARDLIDQVHSIKRTPLQGAHARYEAVSTLHHGDQFWALSLALMSADDDLRATRGADELRILG